MKARLESVAANLARQEWIFAKTMPDNPHEYCLRRRWVGDDEAFVEAVQFIREAGYEAYFEGRPYMQLDIDDHFYWTMGFPVEETILINRKRVTLLPQRRHLGRVGDDDAVLVDPRIPEWAQRQIRPRGPPPCSLFRT